MRRRRLAVLAGVVLVVAVAVAWSAVRGPGSGSGRWEEVEREPFVRRIRAGGELQSADSLVVGCPSVGYMWEFTITSMTSEGKEVAEGDPLLDFDGRSLRERLEVKSSELETSRKELEKDRLTLQDAYDKRVLAVAEARADLARLERELDVPENLRTGIEVEKLKIDTRLAARRLELAEQAVVLQKKSQQLRLAAAERKVKELEQIVERIRGGLEKLRVTAERAGYVVLVPDWRGDKPKVGETVWRGRPILELADLSHMQVAAEVAEADAGYVEEGQQVEIRLDAAPDRLFKGRIRRLGRLFRTKSKDVPSKVFDAVIDIDNPDTELMRPGMAASLEILVPTPEPVIQVPEQAVRRSDDGAWVEVRRGGSRRSEQAPVTLGSRWQGKVVVDAGLEPGDLVRVPDDQG